MMRKSDDEKEEMVVMLRKPAGHCKVNNGGL